MKTINIGIHQLHDIVAHQPTAMCCKCSKKNGNLIVLRTWIIEDKRLAQYYCTSCCEYQVQEYVVVSSDTAMRQSEIAGIGM